MEYHMILVNYKIKKSYAYITLKIMFLPDMGYYMILKYIYKIKKNYTYITSKTFFLFYSI